LKADISTQLGAKLERRATMEIVATRALAAPQAGLNPQQLAALVAIAQQQVTNEGLAIYQIRTEMSNVGFTEIATTIAIRSLIRMGLVETFVAAEYNQDEEYTAYRATERGLDWLEQNQDKLSLRSDTTPRRRDIDDLPF
jgi:hypothetical protein